MIPPDYKALEREAREAAANTETVVDEMRYERLADALALLRAPETQERTIKVWNIEEACGPTSPFEYDQGDIVAVHYDDLYDLVHPRYEHICAVPSPPAQTEK